MKRWTFFFIFFLSVGGAEIPDPDPFDSSTMWDLNIIKTKRFSAFVPNEDSVDSQMLPWVHLNNSSDSEESETDDLVLYQLVVLNCQFYFVKHKIWKTQYK